MWYLPCTVGLSPIFGRLTYLAFYLLSMSNIVLLSLVLVMTQTTFPLLTKSIKSRKFSVLLDMTLLIMLFTLILNFARDACNTVIHLNTADNLKCLLSLLLCLQPEHIILATLSRYDVLIYHTVSKLLKLANELT